MQFTYEQNIYSKLNYIYKTFEINNKVVTLKVNCINKGKIDS